MSFALPRGRGRGPLRGGRRRLDSEREEDVLSGLDGLHTGDSSVRSEKHAVGVKKRKSSNERDSRLPGFVPSLHMVAASTATSSHTATILLPPMQCCWMTMTLILVLVATRTAMVTVVGETHPRLSLPAEVVCPWPSPLLESHMI